MNTMQSQSTFGTIYFIFMVKCVSDYTSGTHLVFFYWLGFKFHYYYYNNELLLHIHIISNNVTNMKV